MPLHRFSFIDEGYCSAAAVEIDPNEGCMTFTPPLYLPEDDWDEDTDELEEWDDVEEEEDEDIWLDDGEDEY